MNRLVRRYLFKLEREKKAQEGNAIVLSWCAANVIRYFASQTVGLAWNLNYLWRRITNFKYSCITINLQHRQSLYLPLHLHQHFTNFSSNNLGYVILHILLYKLYTQFWQNNLKIKQNIFNIRVVVASLSGKELNIIISIARNTWSLSELFSAPWISFKCECYSLQWSIVWNENI